MEKVVHFLNQEISTILFVKTTRVFALKVATNKIGTIMPKIKSFLYNKPRIKNVYPLKDHKFKKVIVLNQQISETDIPAELAEVIKKNDLEITEYEMTSKYEDYTYAQAINILTPKEMTTPGGFEVIGDIAHLNLRENQLPYKYLIGKVILDKTQNVRTVVNKIEKLNNVYRTPILELIAGDPNYETVHIEGKLKFKLDFEKVYWCSRLHQERDRVLQGLEKNQIICDAFCGIGPFALRAAKEVDCLVYASDLNPECYRYLVENIKLNKLCGKVFPSNKDAREFILEILSKVYKSEIERIDHYYMNLPGDAIEFLDVFPKFYSEFPQFLDQSQFKTSQVHVYCFIKKVGKTERMSSLITRISKVMPRIEAKDILSVHSLKSISSEKEMLCVSIQLTPNNCSLSLTKRVPFPEIVKTLTKKVKE